VLALLAGELHAERFLECLADGGEGRQVVAGDAAEGLASVGGEEPGEVLGVGDARADQDDALEVVEELVAALARRLARVGGHVPECLCALGEAEALERRLAAVAVLADEDEVAVVGDDDLAVPPPVAGDLLRRDGDASPFGESLDLDHAAAGHLAAHRVVVVHVLPLVPGEEAAIGVAGAGVAELEDAADLGPEGGRGCGAFL